VKVIYAQDLGNGDIKATSNVYDGVIKFPAVSGRISRHNALLDLGDKGNRLDSMNVTDNFGDSYAVGTMALRNCAMTSHDITDDKYLSSDTELLSSTALSLTSEHMFTVGSLVLGLPVNRMSMAKSVIEAYKGKRLGLKLSFFGEAEQSVKQSQIENVVVVSQPHGTLLNLLLDDNGQIKNKELAKSGVGVYDIGYKTNDGIVFQNLQAIGRLSIGNKKGMFVAYEQIRNMISDRYEGMEIKQYEIPEIIKRGRVRGHNISDIVNESFFNLASNIVMDVKTSWGDAWEVDRIVFTGGGAELLKPYLKHAFPNCILPENCQTSNVEGFLKYGKRLWGEEN
jgi:plasmid segregation protein ParM